MSIPCRSLSIGSVYAWRAPGWDMASGPSFRSESLGGFSRLTLLLGLEGVALGTRLADRVRELGTLRAVAGVSPTIADWRRVLTVALVGTALLFGRNGNESEPP